MIYLVVSNTKKHIFGVFNNYVNATDCVVQAYAYNSTISSELDLVVIAYDKTAFEELLQPLFDAGKYYRPVYIPEER